MSLTRKGSGNSQALIAEKFQAPINCSCVLVMWLSYGKNSYTSRVTYYTCTCTSTHTFLQSQFESHTWQHWPCNWIVGLLQLPCLIKPPKFTRPFLRWSLETRLCTCMQITKISLYTVPVHHLCYSVLSIGFVFPFTCIYILYILLSLLKIYHKCWIQVVGKLQCHH